MEHPSSTRGGGGGGAGADILWNSPIAQIIPDYYSQH